MRSADVARALFFGPDDFYNPELFCSDFGMPNPINMPGWVAGLAQTHPHRYPRTALHTHPHQGSSAPRDAPVRAPSTRSKGSSPVRSLP